MSAHTPGPWEAKSLEPTTLGHDWVDGPDRRFIAVCSEIVGNGPHGYYQSVDLDEISANARLIAAAPELLETLKDALFVMRVEMKIRRPEWDGSATPESSIGKVRAAIARATGETP